MKGEGLGQTLDKALHDLAQPLTTLQCRLYLGSTAEEPTEMVEALRESLVECERVMDRMRQLQDAVEELRVQSGGRL
jgi:phosphoglycerate-specific signal transduction histidine kinase